MYNQVETVIDHDNMPESWMSCIRKALYHHSSDVELYAGKEDLFEHTGKGLWAIRGKGKQMILEVIE